MARKPNYRFERMERERSKAAKRAERQKAKRERAAERKREGAPSGPPDAEPSEGA